MIKTERLSLRRIRKDDWRAVKEIRCAFAETEYGPYDRPADMSDEAVAGRIAKWALCAGSREHLFFAVCLDDTMIGYVAFHKRENGYETGYCFHPDYHGHGYATESMTSLLLFLKAMGVRRVEAGTAIRNTPSVALLTRLGFSLARTEPVSFYKDGSGADIVFEGGVYEKWL